MSTPFRHRSTKGLTLVELVVAMVVMASIGGIGINSLILVMKHQKIMDESKTATESAQWIDMAIRGCVDNLIAAPIGENQPFAERAEADGSQSYVFLNRIPENYVFLQKPEYANESVALLVSLNAVPDKGGKDNDTNLNLTCTTQPISQSGRVGDPDVQTLARGLTQFTITSESAGGTGAGGDGGGGENAVPKFFSVQIGFRSSGDKNISLHQKYPVKVSLPKDKGEEESK